MNYEQKYKEALEWMRSVYDGLHGATKEDAEHYFPELKESEDKQMIERLKSCVYASDLTTGGRNELIAWLEKQCEQSTIIDIDKMVMEYSQTEDGNFGLPINCMIRAYRKGINDALSITLNIEKQGGKDPCIGCTNDKGCVTCENGNLKEIKIEQKFKVGDWVVSNNNEEVWQIGARYTEEGQRIYLYNGNDVMMTITLDELNNDYHLWTIQDAMDGDVLLEEETGEPFIYNGKRGTLLPDDFIGAYCGIHNEEFRQYGSVYYWGKTSCPATKEQRDMLFQQMKEAGYEWDSEKKELKKIEVVSKESEDERIRKTLIEHIKGIKSWNYFLGISKEQMIAWLKKHKED